MITAKDNQTRPPYVDALKTLRARTVDTHKAGHHLEAIALYRQFLASVPNDAAIWSNLGVAHRIRQEFDAAVACYTRALEIRPDDAGFLSNLGNALKDLDQLDEALVAHSKPASIAPSDYNTWANYGIARRDAGRFTESLAEFATTSRFDPKNANPRWDSAVSHLYLGDFSAGWAEYEWRWKIGEFEKRSSPLPEWRGEDPGGSAIYFYPEQGFGDTLLAVCFLPWVKAQSAKVYLECKPPPADTALQAPLMALPGLFRASHGNRRHYRAWRFRKRQVYELGR